MIFAAFLAFSAPLLISGQGNSDSPPNFGYHKFRHIVYAPLGAKLRFSLTTDECRINIGDTELLDQYDVGEGICKEYQKGVSTMLASAAMGDYFKENYVSQTDFAYCQSDTNSNDPLVLKTCAKMCDDMDDACTGFQIVYKRNRNVFPQCYFLKGLTMDLSPDLTLDEAFGPCSNAFMELDLCDDEYEDCRDVATDEQCKCDHEEDGIYFKLISANELMDNTHRPTSSPLEPGMTISPTSPTESPSPKPTTAPSIYPTSSPTNQPSNAPTSAPTPRASPNNGDNIEGGETDEQAPVEENEDDDDDDDTENTPTGGGDGGGSNNTGLIVAVVLLVLLVLAAAMYIGHKRRNQADGGLASADANAIDGNSGIKMTSNPQHSAA